MENLIRAVQIDEHQLLQCIKYGLWGSEKNRKWRQNDILIFFVKDELAAKAKVVGTHFKKGVSVWSDPKFDKLIEIQFESYITRENREIGKEKYLIEASHNKNIDSYLLASKPIESKLAISNIEKFFKVKKNQLSLFTNPSYLDEERKRSLHDRLNEKINNLIRKSKKTRFGDVSESIRIINVIWYLKLFSNEDYRRVYFDETFKETPKFTPSVPISNQIEYYNNFEFHNYLMNLGGISALFGFSLVSLNLQDKLIYRIDQELDSLFQEIVYAQKNFTNGVSEFVDYMGYCHSIISNVGEINSKMNFSSTRIGLANNISKLISGFLVNKSEIFDPISSNGVLIASISRMNKEKLKRVNFSDQSTVSIELTALHCIINKIPFSKINAVHTVKQKEDGKFDLIVFNSTYHTKGKIESVFNESLPLLNSESFLFGIVSNSLFTDSENLLKLRRGIVDVAKNIIVIPIVEDNMQETCLIIINKSISNVSNNHNIYILDKGLFSDEINEKEILELSKGIKDIFQFNKEYKTIKSLNATEFIEGNYTFPTEMPIDIQIETSIDENLFLNLPIGKKIDSNIAIELKRHAILKNLSEEQLQVVNFLYKNSKREMSTKKIYESYLFHVVTNGDSRRMNMYSFKQTMDLLLSFGIIQKKYKKEYLNESLKENVIGEIEVWCINPNFEILEKEEAYED